MVIVKIKLFYIIEIVIIHFNCCVGGWMLARHMDRVAPLFNFHFGLYPAYKHINILGAKILLQVFH